MPHQPPSKAGRSWEATPTAIEAPSRGETFYLSVCGLSGPCSPAPGRSSEDSLLRGFAVGVGVNPVAPDAWRRRKPTALLKILAFISRAYCE